MSNTNSTLILPKLLHWTLPLRQLQITYHVVLTQYTYSHVVPFQIQMASFTHHSCKNYALEHESIRKLIQRSRIWPMTSDHMASLLSPSLINISPDFLIASPSSDDASSGALYLPVTSDGRNRIKHIEKFDQLKRSSGMDLFGQHFAIQKPVTPVTALVIFHRISIRLNGFFRYSWQLIHSIPINGEGGGGRTLPLT